MTFVEPPSTRSHLVHRFRTSACALAAALVAGAGIVPLTLSGRAGADPLADARAEAAQITAQIQSENQQIEVLGQQYDADQQQVQALDQSVAKTQGQIRLTRQRIATAQANLRQQALQAYMSGSGAEGLDSLFQSASESASAAQEYRDVANGNLSDAIDALHVAQSSLTAQEDQLQATDNQERAVTAQVASARQQAETLQSQETATLTHVQGQIAQLVQQQQEAEAAAAAAAFRQRIAQEQAAQAAAAARAQAAAQASGGGSSGSFGGSGGGGSGAGGSGAGGAGGASGVGTVVPVAPGAAGAVQAAESQLGVPYVWGGETPGVGFDCSGLTQWSWGQAGVSLPRTAAEQYDAITHVSLDQLEPGDLLFWNDGTASIQHVAMYVGNGEVIQAPYTGSVVSYAPIWDNGLVGAGRP